MCVGCGACAAVCAGGAVRLVDVLDAGIRPLVTRDACSSCGECLQVCPGYRVDHKRSTWPRGTIAELRKGFGPVLEVWEGHASDPEVRYAASSGGVASMLSLYCIEKRGMAGIVQAGAEPDRPWKNMTVASRTRDDVLSRSGSRYAPASPCEAMGWLREADSPWVFVGKPCDVAAVARERTRDSALDKGLGCAISVFCAGTPATRGTLSLLGTLGAAVQDVEDLRYRGGGWPGAFTVKSRGSLQPPLSLSYREAWHHLQKFRPYRCHLCPDGTGEFADIACGDPWYRPQQPGEMGLSLVVVRSERGRRIVQGAMEEGYLRLQPGTPRMLLDSQPALLAKRSAVWGRRTALRLFGIPSPRLRGFSLFSLWMQSNVSTKLKSLLGTVRRIIERRYYQPHAYMAGETQAHHLHDYEKAAAAEWVGPRSVEHEAR